MRLTTLATAAAFISTSASAPTPTPQFDIGALLGGLGGAGGGGIGSLLGGLSGGSGGGAAVDTAPLLKTYDTLKAQADKLNDIILKFSNATSPSAVLKEYLAAGQDTVKAYKDSTAVATALNSTVGLMAVIGFQQPRSSLTASTETALGNLASKKDIIAKANGTAQVLVNLKDQKEAASGYSAAILAKLPEIAKGIAQSSSQKPVEAFDKAIAAFT
jgi:hypothetical protein